MPQPITVRGVAARGLVVTWTVALLAGGCGPLDGGPTAAGHGNPGTAAGRGNPGTAESGAAAQGQLDELAVAGWASMSGYRRDRFDHWSSQGNSCDTRDAVLQRDGEDVVTAADCKITGGTWFSAYDGATISDPGELDIDHMIPLANAWRTGAKDWTPEQRKEFANDLNRPQLIAVTATTNRSKGDQDPSQWRPPRSAYWCTYAQSWVAVKSYWRLSVTIDEKAALAVMLETCP